MAALDTVRDFPPRKFLDRLGYILMILYLVVGVVLAVVGILAFIPPIIGIPTRLVDMVFGTNTTDIVREVYAWMEGLATFMILVNAVLLPMYEYTGQSVSKQVFGRVICFAMLIAAGALSMFTYYWAAYFGPLDAWLWWVPLAHFAMALVFVLILGWSQA